MLGIKRLTIITNFDTSYTEIIVNPNSLSGTCTVNVDCSKDKIITVLCNNDKIHYELFSNGNDSTNIVFTYSLDNVLSTKYEIDFTYVVLTKMELL